MDSTKRNHEEPKETDEIQDKVKYLLKLTNNLEKWNGELRQRIKALRYKGFEYEEGICLSHEDVYKNQMRKTLRETLPENVLNPVINRLADIMLMFMSNDAVEGKLIKSKHEISKPTHARDMILLQKTGLIELKNGYRKKGVFVLTQSGKEFQNAVLDSVDGAVSTSRK